MNEEEESINQSFFFSGRFYKNMNLMNQSIFSFLTDVFIKI